MSQDVNDPRGLTRRRSFTTGDLGSASDPPPSNGFLLSKIRNLNSLAMSSLGSLFSGTPSAGCRRTSAYMRGDSDAEETSVGLDATCAWNDDDPESSTQKSESLKENRDEYEDNDLTPIAREYCNLRAEDYCAAKALDYLSVSPDIATRGRRLSAESATAVAQTHSSTRFPEVRRFLGGLSRSRRATVVRDEKWELQSPDSDLGSTARFAEALQVQSVPSLSSVPSTRSGDLETPPLTPDSFNNFALASSPALSLGCFDSSLGLEDFCISGDDDSFGGTSTTEKQGEDTEEQNVLYASPQLLKVKEGKKPERYNPVPDNAEQKVSASNARGIRFRSSAAPNEQEEWYGLEYTLELSSRECQPFSDGTQSVSVGEHSRSRESWAAIHRGSIHPLFEDEDYLQWKNWHRFLDRQDEKRRHQKGLQFKSRATELAWLYVDEMLTRDVLYWQKEAYGVVSRDVEERLYYIGERRPDPFFPPREHNLSWFLKRSHSLGCLRELKAEEECIAAEDTRIIGCRNGNRAVSEY